jgi:hypothetical protein
MVLVHFTHFALSLREHTLKPLSLFAFPVFSVAGSGT